MKNKDLKVHVVSDEELHLTMRSLRELIQPIRKELKEFARIKGFDHRQIFEIQLAVNEALANIIEHAYQGKDMGEIEMNVGTDENGDLRIAIQDFAEKVDVSKLVSRDLDVMEDGGIGIFLINSLMDNVEYDLSQKIGTRLILTKRKK